MKNDFETILIFLRRTRQRLGLAPMYFHLEWKIRDHKVLNKRLRKMILKIF